MWEHCVINAFHWLKNSETLSQLPHFCQIINNKMNSYFHFRQLDNDMQLVYMSDLMH